MYFSWPLPGLVSSIRCSGGTAANTRPASSMRPHVAEEQCQQQGPDVRAVDVRVGHQDDPA